MQTNVERERETETGDRAQTDRIDVKKLYTGTKQVTVSAMNLHGAHQTPVLQIWKRYSQARLT